MNKKIPTIKEIAAKLRLSPSTVSRALSNNPRISSVTRERVQRLAAEIGYEPNSLAIGFRQKRTNVIGVIVPHIREEFFSEAISGIESVALQHDYSILLGQSYDNLIQETKVAGTMKKQRVDGLIISLAKETTSIKHLDPLSNYGIPIVYFDRVPHSVDTNMVCCDLYKGTVEMVDWFFVHGFRNIALINGPSKLQASKERFKGYVDGISKRKIKVNMQLVEKTDFSKESTYAAMQKLLTLKKTPTAIITFNEYVHMDAVQYVRQHNFLSSDEIAFGSYANLPITNHIADPPLVSIEQYPYKQGEKAMELLLDILKSKFSDAPSATRLSQLCTMPTTLMVHCDSKL
ncbi:LacI family DNA-binding transcriptional regulator [Chitinophaga sp. Ak27]|uniref:LacI family DNA-binding transcriptional regulator n=1 Tax=Chitinophaga sp. Ak27 TaxID=2726116 RepID=UPI00145DBFFD|nr:LacI family DNA-binding transcriptional regulator [Chitinophaga sp. Ak27]NLU90486.1 LacI family transcriptional regulator [Chitinophaga sp. Ak27]